MNPRMNLSSAAGHLFIAGALGFSLLVMLPMLAPPVSRTIAWLALAALGH